MRKAKRLFAPAIVLTGHQIAGRGRGTNTWWSGEGSLTATFVLPIDERLEPHQIPLLAGLAVRSAAVELTGGADVQLKWPNDLLFDGRKLAGLLCERVGNADLIGVGMNVNISRRDLPASLRNHVTTLSWITGTPLDLTRSLAVLTSHLQRVMARRRDQHPFSEFLREYDQHHALIGRKVEIVSNDGHPPIRGRCEGLDRIGRLLVRTSSGLKPVIAGQVRTD